jgi:DNA polymerase-3 subunit delta
MVMSRFLSPSELLRELKSGEFAPVYLLAGPDSFRLERTARWLRERGVDAGLSDFNAETLYAEDSSPARIAETANAYPMFGGRRLVWVRHAESLPSGAQIEPLLRYLGQPSQSTVLILSANKLDRRLKLTSLCAEVGCVVEFALLSGVELRRQLQRQAKEHGVELSDGAADVLTELVGEDLAELDAELAKLALFGDVDARRIEAIEVRELVARSRDVDAFALADALDCAAPSGALALWCDLRRDGGDLIGAAGIVGWRLRQLAQLAAALEETQDEARASKLVGLAPWQARRLLSLVASTNVERSAAALAAWRQADRRAKSSSLGAEFAYDLAMLEWALSA